MLLSALDGTKKRKSKQRKKETGPNKEGTLRKKKGNKKTTVSLGGRGGREVEEGGVSGEKFCVRGRVNPTTR